MRKPSNGMFVIAVAVFIARARTRLLRFSRPRTRIPMGEHMDAKTTALCYFYRHPPRQSGVKPVPYRKIPKLLPVRPLPTLNQVWRAVKTFHFVTWLVRCLFITCTLLDHFA